MQNEEDMRLRAYKLCKLEGRPEGRHIDHWEQACRDYAEDEARAANIAIGSDAGSGVGNLGLAAAALRDENQGISGGEIADAQDRDGRAVEVPALGTSS